MRFTKLLGQIALFGSLASQPLLAQTRLSTAEVKNHINERATVCGSVVSTRYATSTKGQPTFLNLDKPYPNQIFTMVIWGTDHTKFGRPEVDYKEKQLCITGKVTEYRGVPEIVVNEPNQITLEPSK